MATSLDSSRQTLSRAQIGPESVAALETIVRRETASEMVGRTKTRQNLAELHGPLVEAAASNQTQVCSWKYFFVSPALIKIWLITMFAILVY
jgi:hypothetical protein